MNNNWGGTRKGSGRKVIPEELKKRGYTFQLSENDIKFIESFEGKNRSDSLREMIQEYRNLDKKT